MNRPQPDVYELPNLKVEFSFKKLIASVLSVVIFLILPIAGIDSLIRSSNAPPVTQGQVAGISTSTISSDNNIYILGQTIDLNSQSSILAIGGLILLGLAIILTIYLIIDSSLTSKPKHRKVKVR